MKLGRHHTISDEIPTASTADIAFLLVIFFMLTVTFAASRGMDLRVPPDEEVAVVDPVESVHVHVQADGSILVDRRPLALEALTAYLRPRLEQDPRKPVILETEPTAPYGAMVAVYDGLRGAGAVLGLEADVVIAIPTRREIAHFWS